MTYMLGTQSFIINEICPIVANSIALDLEEMKAVITIPGVNTQIKIAWGIKTDDTPITVGQKGVTLKHEGRIITKSLDGNVQAEFPINLPIIGNIGSIRLSENNAYYFFPTFEGEEMDLKVGFGTILSDDKVFMASEYQITSYPDNTNESSLSTKIEIIRDPQEEVKVAAKVLVVALGVVALCVAPWTAIIAAAKVSATSAITYAIVNAENIMIAVDNFLNKNLIPIKIPLVK